MNRQFRIPSQNNSPLIVNGVIQNDLVDFRLSEHMKPHQCALVRDAYLFLGKHGKVEERLDADTINANIKLYVLDDDGMRKARKGNPFARRDDVSQSILDNPFRILNKNSAAQQVEVECQIQLSDILRYVIYDSSITQGTPTYGAIQPVVGNAGVTPDLFTLITSRQYPEGLKFAPFWINQRIAMTRTIVGQNPSTTNTTITGISVNADNRLTLTVANALRPGANPGPAVNTISVIGVDAGTNVQLANLLNVAEAELVVKSAVKSNKKQSYEYLVYDLEKDSSNQNTHKRTYEVPAGCVGVSILFPDDTGRLSALPGINGRQVKLSINSEDVNQGHVMRYGDSLERDLKERFFMNLGYQQVRNLQSYSGSLSGAASGSEGVYFPIPESDMVQTLTVEIFNNAAVGLINLYKFRIVNL